ASVAYTNKFLRLLTIGTRTKFHRSFSRRKWRVSLQRRRFRRSAGKVLRTHLQTQPADWLAELIQRSPNAAGAMGFLQISQARLDDPRRLLPPLGLGSLLDLLQTGISVADPIPCLIDLRWIDGNSARNFFASRNERSFIFHWLGAFDGKLPMMPE